MNSLSDPLCQFEILFYQQFFIDKYSFTLKHEYISVLIFIRLLKYVQAINDFVIAK